VKQNFAVIILGGTGQVGGAAVAELLATSECREVVMVTRKPVAPRSRVRNVVLDTSAADFAERTAALARGVLSQGPVSAVSCVGVGSGSMRWSEEELKQLELASSVPLRVAVMTPESRSSACFPRQEAQLAAGFVMCG
jgi:NAD dependent epimerase/dehydratase family enzyme